MICPARTLRLLSQPLRKLATEGASRPVAVTMGTLVLEEDRAMLALIQTTNSRRSERVAPFHSLFKASTLVGFLTSPALIAASRTLLSLPSRYSAWITGNSSFNLFLK